MGNNESPRCGDIFVYRGNAADGHHGKFDSRDLEESLNINVVPHSG